MDADTENEWYIVADVNQDQADANRHFVESHGMREIVTILDAQSHIEQYYREFNIFILSSVYESCPNALFEAMLARCLCIVSNGANTDSFIRDGINGSVYNGTTAHLTEKLISAVELVLSNRHQTMIENAQRYAMENFSVDSMADSYVKIYEMIMSDRRKNWILKIRWSVMFVSFIDKVAWEGKDLNQYHWQVQYLVQEVSWFLFAE